MKTYCSRRLANVALVVVLAFGAVRATDATVIIGGSAGDGATVSLTFTPVIGSALTASAGPFPSASGLAPPPYSVSASSLAFPLPLLSVSLLSDNAASDVDGLPGVRFADADSTITNLSLGPLFPGLPPIITLFLSSMGSTADVTGDFPTLTPTGSTILVGGVFAIPILGITPITLAGSPPRNTQVGVPALGVSVLLNEQILTGNGATFQRIEVNGLHAAFALPVFSSPIPPLPPVFLGTLTGDLIAARSIATLVAVPTPVAVPEPPILVLVAVGLVLMCWSGGRKGARNRFLSHRVL